jgi:hypothetical protein
MKERVLGFVLPLRDFFLNYTYDAYQPIWFIFHSMYVCLSVRSFTGRNGLPFYRSFPLAWLITVGPRYCFSLAAGVQIPKFPGNENTFSVFFIIWAFFNIFPFDFVFKISYYLSIAIRLLDAVAEASSLTQMSAYQIAGHDVTSLELCVLLCLCAFVPFIVDVLDRFFYADWNCPKMYQSHHICRMILGSVFLFLRPKSQCKDTFRFLLVLYFFVEVVKWFVSLDWKRTQMFFTAVNHYYHHTREERKQD